MSKIRPSQMELFSRDEESEQLVARPADSGLMDYVKMYEKAIMLVIGFVVTGIIAFCIGVEKGKSIAMSSSGSRFDVAARNNVPAAAAAFTRREIPGSSPKGTVDQTPSFSIKGRIKNIPVRQEIIIQPQPEVSKNGYTIQIASYQARSGAEKEMANLRQNGMTPLIIKKGNYNVLCVGTFANKETARSLLTQLKSKYRDCYIRRL